MSTLIFFRGTSLTAVPPLPGGKAGGLIWGPPLEKKVEGENWDPHLAGNQKGILEEAGATLKTYTPLELTPKGKMGGELLMKGLLGEKVEGGQRLEG